MNTIKPTPFVDEEIEEIISLRAENAKLRKTLDDAGDRLFEHHNTSYRPEAGEICTICTKSGNIFERIDALLKPADRATGHGSADGDDDD